MKNEPSSVKITKNICVFCSSSDAVNPIYFKVARDLGTRLALKGYRLVYGGGNVGLMGELARAVKENGGQVLAIIPKLLHEKTAALSGEHELIVTLDMRERKTLMELRSDAFIGLPGGFGTLEELFEMMTLRQLGYHAKPIVLVNAHKFYDPLISLFDHIYEQKFAQDKHRRLYEVVAELQDIFPLIEPS